MQLLHLPGINTFFEICLSKLDLEYKSQTSIDEHFLTKTTKLKFIFKTIQTISVLSAYRVTGFSITFCLVHLIFVIKSFNYVFIWLKALSAFIKYNSCVKYL